MQRSTLVTAGVAFLCVLALAFAAAALPSPQPGGGSIGNGTGSAGIFGDTEPPEVDPVPGLPPWARRLLLALVVAGVLGGVAVTLQRPKETLRYVVMALVPMLILAALLYLLGLVLGSLTGGGTVGFSGGPGSGTLESGEAEALGLDPAVLAVVAAAVVLLALVLVRYYDGRSATLDTLAGSEEPAPGEDAATALGSIAGETADRIEERSDPPVANEVYRAWREMTRHLDVPFPETSTPAEFADAAVEAGMDEGDVAELTALFREVRYGGAEPTADREERAVSVLRRIEDAYADE